MKTLVVYYSLEGNTAFLGEAVAQALGADTLRLHPVNDLSPKGVMKYLWGGTQVMTKRTPALAPCEKNPQDYGMLFIGTPVWVWSCAPALATFFSKEKFSGKKIALFCCYQSSRGKTFDAMRRHLAGNTVVGEFGCADPLRHNPERSRDMVQQWARQMTGEQSQ